MSATTDEDHVNRVLVLSGDPIPETKFGSFTMLFINLTMLINHIFDHIKDTNSFDLHIPGQYLEELFEKLDYRIEQIRRIYVYYDNSDILQGVQHRYESISDKFQFHHKRDLEKKLENAAFPRIAFSSRSTVRNREEQISSTIMERVSNKRSHIPNSHSPVPKRVASTKIDLRFLCSSCKSLFSEPHQLECGHRQCKLCVNIQNNCATCSEVISKDKVFLDRAFQYEMQNLMTTCLECEWTGSLKLYQKHIDQKHSQVTICPLCHERVEPSRVHQHYSSEMQDRQKFILLESMYITNNNNTNIANDDVQRMHSTNDNVHIMETKQNSSYQEMLSLEKRDGDVLTTSFNETYVWKITNFQEKRMDSISERQKSIYSPSFYSSPSGYKLCVRLFLNGDGSTRDRFMSLFLVIMRGDNDSIIEWPFKYKTTFCLIDQLSSNNNKSDFFWANSSSKCFQRPITDMNMAYGFSEFISLDQFKKNQYQYVQNDTMIIKVEVDLSAEKPKRQLFTDAGELLNDDGHVDTPDVHLTRLVCYSDQLE